MGLGRKQSYRLELLEFQVCWSLRSLLYTFITDGITISALRVLVAIWVLLFAAIMRLQETKILFLFEYIPLGIQIATMIVCFMALFILVGRMEEKDAYTFAY